MVPIRAPPVVYEKLRRKPGLYYVLILFSRTESFMFQTLTRRSSRRSAYRDCRPPCTSGAALESLEDRIVLSAAAIAPTVAPTEAAEAPLAGAIDVSEVVVTETGELVANAVIFGQAVELPISLGTDGDTATDILNLEIGAINLDLLGLVVETSDICLDIVAQPGEGNLLGNLLSGVAGLLDSGTPLSDVLGDLTPEELETLTTGLTDLLNGVFDNVLASPASEGGAAVAQVGETTDILNLALGPVDLNLLGLEVHLDDCADGPVTIDIFAEEGSGNLLGNLLGSVAHLLDRDPGNAINAKLDRLEREIAKLADEALVA